MKLSRKKSLLSSCLNGSNHAKIMWASSYIAAIASLCPNRFMGTKSTKDVNNVEKFPTPHRLCIFLFNHKTRVYKISLKFQRFAVKCVKINNKRN